MSSPNVKFTYARDPSKSPRDAVRFLVGDINHERPLLDDKEIDYAIAQQPNENLAAALLAEHLFGRFAQRADITVGSVSKSYSRVAELYKNKSEQLKSEACINARVSFPATHVSTKRALEDNNDLTAPNFFVGIGDNRFAVQLNDILDEARFYGFYP